MDLNEKQNQLISEFHTKFGHADHSGRIVHDQLHITDIRKLVEDCLAAEDEEGGEGNE